MSTDRVKVLHVTTVDSSLEALLRPQLLAFAEAGFEVVTASAPGPYVTGLEAAGIRHVALANSTRAMDPRRDLSLALELYRLFRAEKPEIVHTHNPKPGWFGRPAARAARVPVVVNTVHGLYAGPTDPLVRRVLVYALERMAVTCSDAELLQSVEDVDVLRMLRVPAERITVLGNGIDLDRFGPPTAQARAEARQSLGLHDDDIAVGAVGRLVWEKGLREVVATAASLQRSHPRAKLLVAGPLDPDKSDGLEPSDLERISRDSGLRFVGEQSRIEDFYAALDMYVLASYREGFPRSAMEAAACGLALVLSDIRGCRQVVDHGINGVLVPPGDAGALAAAVGQLLDDPQRRAAMGEASVAKAAAEFDQQRVIDITVDTYHRLLANTRR